MFHVCRKPVRSAVFLLAGIALAVAGGLIGVSPVTAGGWQGSQETRDGVTTVHNPGTGFKKQKSIALEELWRVGGDSDDEGQLFGVISDIDIDDDGNVYLLDSQLNEVKIFSADGEFIRSIGREGEGPGEFKAASALFFTKDGNIAVVQTLPAKVVLLTPEGDPAGEMQIPKPADGGFQMVQNAQTGGGNLVMFMSRQSMDAATKKWSRTSFLTSVKDGKQGVEYASRENVIDFAAAVLDDAKYSTLERRWTVGPNGKVYACPSYEDYTVSVWNADGSPDRVITRDYRHLARTADEKKFWGNLMGFYAKRVPNCQVKINDQCRDIEKIFVRDDGSIWVMNSRGARDLDDGSLGEFDVYSADGHFVRTVALTGQGDPLKDLYVIVKNRFYVVTSFLQAALVAQGVEGLYDDAEDAEPMAVISYRLEGDVLAAR